MQNLSKKNLKQIQKKTTRGDHSEFCGYYFDRGLQACPSILFDFSINLYNEFLLRSGSWRKLNSCMLFLAILLTKLWI